MNGVMLVRFFDPDKYITLHQMFHHGMISGMTMRLASGRIAVVRIVACHPDLPAFSVVEAEVN